MAKPGPTLMDEGRPFLCLPLQVQGVLSIVSRVNGVRLDSSERDVRDAHRATEPGTTIAKPRSASIQSRPQSL